VGPPAEVSAAHLVPLSIGALLLLLGGRSLRRPKARPWLPAIVLSVLCADVSLGSGFSGSGSWSPSRRPAADASVPAQNDAAPRRFAISPLQQALHAKLPPAPAVDERLWLVWDLEEAGSPTRARGQIAAVGAPFLRLGEVEVELLRRGRIRGVIRGRGGGEILATIKGRLTPRGLRGLFVAANGERGSFVWRLPGAELFRPIREQLLLRGAERRGAERKEAATP
jgi:hypothetical protein